MRKIRILNNASQTSKNIFESIRNRTYREENAGRASNSYTFNRVAINPCFQKVVPSPNKTFPGQAKSGNDSLVPANTKNVVLLHDLRKEVSKVQDRTIITTSLICEELMQTNRGVQEYERDRNRFFVDDGCINAEAINAYNKIYLLDLLWFMEENQLTAVEVVDGVSEEAIKGIHEPKYGEFFSKRYGNAAIKIGELYAKGRTAYFDEGTKFMQVLQKSAGKNDIIKEEFDVQALFSHKNVLKFLGFNSSNEQNEIYTKVKRYIGSCQGFHRRNTALLVAHSNDAAFKSSIEYERFKKDWFPGTFQEWSSKEMYTFRQTYTVSVPALAYCFGMAELVENGALKVCLGHINDIARYPVVKTSKFKRNPDWRLEDSNFYKKEVLTLRKLMQEGSFCE